MISLKNIYKKFDDNILFENFDMEFNDNEISCILGPSGVGKTTLVNIIAGITKVDSGKVLMNKNTVFSYIFQEPRLLNWYSVYDNLDFVLKDILESDDRKKIINKYLDIVELSKYKDYKPKALSGGMAQRVSIARAFAYPSNILIMDEPFKGLDFKLKNELMNSFMKLWKEDKRTVLFITHDIDESIKLSNNIYILKESPAKIIKKISINHNENIETLKNYLINIL